jgi:hypothetical protein
MNLFRRESSWLNLAFTNHAEGFNHVRGQFDVPQVEVPAMTYRVLRDPFGTPARAGWGMMRRGMRGQLAMPMAMAAAPADAVADGALRKADATREEATNEAGMAAGDKQGPGEPPAAAAAPAPPPPRKNLVETAFFLPTLSSGTDGVVTIEFTLPDTLTTWQFKGLAHDAALRSGVIVDTCVSVKDLMVEPIMPRFLRAGDVVQIPVKVSNKSTGRLAGTVKFALADARTDADRGGLIDGPRELPFDLAAGESKPVVFTVKVADGTETLRYLATGSAGKAADGEEALIIVLPRRVLVSESVPVTIRGPGARKVSLERLAKSAGTDIQSQSLVVQATSNPAWYAVLALPSIMEDSDESTETLFTRLYANSLARHLAPSDPRIGKVFEQWKGTDALTSPLEKNSDLVKTLLAETPWVRDAVDETEARARIALLFDATRAGNETQADLRLRHARHPRRVRPAAGGGCEDRAACRQRHGPACPPDDPLARRPARRGAGMGPQGLEGQDRGHRPHADRRLRPLRAELLHGRRPAPGRGGGGDPLGLRRRQKMLDEARRPAHAGAARDRACPLGRQEDGAFHHRQPQAAGG